MNSTAYDNPGFIIDYNVASSSCSIQKISHQNIIRQKSMSNRGNIKAYDIQYKVLLLGDTQVGKTSLQRFISDKNFNPAIGSTFGIDFVQKIIPVERANVNLQIWDTAGQKNFRTIGKSHYSATKAFILVYDVTNRDTFSLIEQFNKFIEQAGLDTERRYLVANKIDLVEQRVVDEDEGQRFAMRNTMTYFETSCKTGDNVSNLFEQIASDLIHLHHPQLLKARPSRSNFVFDYGPTPDPAPEPVMRPLPENSKLIQKKEGFNFRRLLFCCNPKKTTTTTSF